MTDAGCQDPHANLACAWLGKRQVLDRGRIAGPAENGRADVHHVSPSRRRSTGLAGT
jgi:hypothetical protein